MTRPTMHLQAILDHDAVTAPRQKRSHRTLERILAALGELLREKSFEQISMVELAERAGCAVTSIYARFKDKWAMIAALHESFREDAIGRIDGFLDPERWRAATANEIIAATVDALTDSYHQHRHLLHAVLLTDDPAVYNRATSVARHAATRLAQVLPPPAGAAPDPFRRRVQFAVRVVIATLQQMVLLDVVPGERGHPDAELAHELQNVVTSYLGYSPQRRGRANRRTEPHTKETSR